MHNASFVGVLERIAELAGEFETTVEWKRMFFLENGVKIPAVHEGHGDEFHAVGLAQVVNAQDILVRDSAGEKKFVFEALNDLGIAGEVGLQDFQSNETVEFAIVGFVDAAHAAFAKKILDDKARSKFFTVFK